ncbi:MAG: hypothetical protein J6L69_09555 [Lachnospiraceae bacterium]|nr:hypothetical protein [Lachnospiraceae bacterium]
MKKIQKSKIIILSICVILGVALVGFVYYYFSFKNYKMYIKETEWDISAVLINTDEYEDVPIYIQNEEVVSRIFDELEGLKAKPVLSEENGDYGFKIEFIDADNRRWMFNAKSCGEHYYLNMYTTTSEGKGGEDSIWNIFGSLNITKEDGDRIYDLVSELYSENSKCISVDEIKDLSKEEKIDWEKMKRYQREEMKNAERIEINGETADYPQKFEIEGKKGYLVVWYIEGHNLQPKEGEEYYFSDVLKIEVYKETGECVDLYDDTLFEFLEEME